MTRGLSKNDISDLDFVDAPELESDGQSFFLTGFSVVSTTSATKRIVLSGVHIINDPDQRVEPTDIVILSGTSGADGNYTVAAIVDDVTFEVTEAIADSTGGTANFRWPPGASRVGFDPTGLVQTTAHTVQEAIKDLDSAITGGGITEAQHEVLDTLVHEIDETNWEEVTRVGGKVTNITQWTNSGKTKKIRETVIARSGGKVSQVDVIQYDGSGVESMRNTGVITRAGGKVTSIQWTKTGSP